MGIYYGKCCLKLKVYEFDIVFHYFDHANKVDVKMAMWSCTDIYAVIDKIM